MRVLEKKVRSIVRRELVSEGYEDMGDYLLADWSYEDGLRAEKLRGSEVEVEFDHIRSKTVKVDLEGRWVSAMQNGREVAKYLSEVADQGGFQPASFFGKVEAVPLRGGSEWDVFDVRCDRAVVGAEVSGKDANRLYNNVFDSPIDIGAPEINARL